MGYTVYTVCLKRDIVGNLFSSKVDDLILSSIVLLSRIGSVPLCLLNQCYESCVTEEVLRENGHRLDVFLSEVIQHIQSASATTSATSLS